MTGRAENEGLTLGYRLLYRVRRLALSIYGPAQLGEGDDPIRRLERERAAKVEAARQKRLQNGHEV